MRFTNISTAAITHVVAIILLMSNPTVMADLSEDSLLLQLSGDEEMISIATGTPRPVSKAPAIATVISAAEIRNSGAKTVQEALERIPGLHVSFSSFLGRDLYSLRGIQTGLNPHMLVLFNNVAITSLLNGSHAARLHLPVENIDHIEIIRGPGSIIHGADAFAGTINIVTKTDKDIKGWHSGLKGGSFGTRNIWGQYGGQHNQWHLAASSEYSSSNGDRQRIIDQDLQTIIDGNFGTNASLAPAALDTRYESLVNSLFLERGHWGIQLNSWNQRDTGIGSGSSNVLDPDASHEIEQYLINVQYRLPQWKPHWALQSSLSYRYLKTEDRLTIFPPGSLLPVGADGNINFFAPTALYSFTNGAIDNADGLHEEVQFSLATLYAGMRDHLWRFSVGGKYERLRTRESKNFGPGVIDEDTPNPIDDSLTNVSDTPFSFNPGGNRSVYFISIQDEWGFAPDWAITSGVRIDHYSDFGSVINPRLSLVWNTRHNLTSKLLYGRAFRAPSFSELLSRNNPIGIGNPDLDAETIDTLELAFDYKPVNNVNLLFNLFHYHIDGLIDFIDDDGAPGGTATAKNIKDQNASGLELEARWQVNEQLRLTGSFAAHNAKDADSGEKVANSPRKQFHLSGHWRFNQQWSAQLDSFHISDRLRTAADPRAAVDDYTWVNLNIIVNNVFKDVELQLAIRNLTDTDAREPGPQTTPNDYPLEGRGIFLGLSVDL